MCEYSSAEQTKRLAVHFSNSTDMVQAKEKSNLIKFFDQM